jgi:hypothetical protein
MLFSNYLVMPVDAGSEEFWGGKMIAAKSLEEWAIECWNWSITIPVDIPKDPATKLAEENSVFELH